jgi:hypothetical protein
MFARTILLDYIVMLSMITALRTVCAALAHNPANFNPALISDKVRLVAVNHIALSPTRIDMRFI